MDNKDGGHTLKGIAVDITIETGAPHKMQLNYNNLQLGKYSDGNGGCHVGICYECYIDGLFHIG